MANRTSQRRKSFDRWLSTYPFHLADLWVCYGKCKIFTEFRCSTWYDLRTVECWMSRPLPSALVEGSLKIKLSTYSNRFDIGETYFYHYSSQFIRFVRDVKSICTIFGVGATFSFVRLTYFVWMLVNHGMHCDFDMIYNSSYIFCFALFILKK